MKYLKYAIGIIAILVIGFLILGLIKPKVTYECEIIVEKPLTETWAVLQDQEKLSEWLPGFQKNGACQRYSRNSRRCIKCLF